MKRKTILIVDDESYIREFLAQVLSEYFHVIFAKNSEEAVLFAKTNAPDIILLDVLMPGIDGMETCKLLRQQPESALIPIIMVTAVNDLDKKVQAFQYGADDYLEKPFLPEELIARLIRKLETQAQRERRTDNGGEILHGNLKLQADSLLLQINETSHHLGLVEFKILNFLLKHKGTLVSRQELNDYVWGADLPSERALDPHITSLRKKLQKSQGELKTVYGKGYSIILKEVES